MTMDRDKALLEALLFASPNPVSLDALHEITGMGRKRIRAMLEELGRDLEDQYRGYTLKEVAGGFQLRTRQEFSAEIKKLHQARPRRRFTRSSLETLAIIAYRQPATRAEVEDVRGVDSGAVVKNLLTQDMIRILGRKEAPGRPMLYGTTRKFLEYFELRDLESLPTLEEITEILEEPEEATALLVEEEVQMLEGERGRGGEGGDAPEPEDRGIGETGNGLPEEAEEAEEDDHDDEGEDTGDR